MRETIADTDRATESGQTTGQPIPPVGAAFIRSAIDGISSIHTESPVPDSTKRLLRDRLNARRDELRAVWRYVPAVAGAIVTLVLFQSFSYFGIDLPLTTLGLATVIIVTWIGGFGPGLLATVFFIGAGTWINIEANGDSTRILADYLAHTVLYVTLAYLIDSRRQIGIELERSMDDLADVRHALDASTIVAISDRFGNITYANDKFCKVSGFQREELIGRSHRVIASDFHSEEFYKDLWQTISSGKIWNGEIRNKTKDGTIFWVDTTIVPFLNENSVPYQYVSISTEITERKRVEAAYTLNGILIENSFEPIMVWDFNNGIIDWNKGCEKLYGYSREEAIGKLSYAVLRTQFPVPVVDYVKQLRDDSVWAGEVVQFAKDGRELIVESRSQLTIIDGREVVLVTNRDVTETKRLEKEQRESEQHLIQVQKLESVGRLAGGIAHDFNNMLTAINGYSELTLRTLGPEAPIRKNIEEIRSAARRSADLTQQLLAFSRRQILQPAVLNLNRVIADTMVLLQRLIGEDIELVSFLSPEVGKIKADPGQLSQVIMNLVINARDAMPRGGTIMIETGNVTLDETYAGRHVSVRPGDYVLMAVTDTGAGMANDVLTHVFEPFFTTKETGKGTGLGLATVYGIVKQSGGNIWAYSEPGRGTSFKVYLPRIAESANSIDLIPATSQRVGGDETVLLVEDEHMVRQLTREVLETCGYCVIEAQNGVEAMALCGDGKKEIDLLLTDIVMPQMGGPELAEKLTPIYPNMRVLFTSGYTDKAIFKNGFIDDDKNFIQKPFTFDDLSTKVRETLDCR